MWSYNRGQKTELALIDRAIKDTEIRLKTIQIHLEALEKEINYFSILEKQLEENFKYLKQDKIIALASEFKKTKEELQRVRSFLAIRRKDLEAHRKAFKAANNHLDLCKKRYEQLIKYETNNVIQGIFGRKGNE